MYVLSATLPPSFLFSTPSSVCKLPYSRYLSLSPSLSLSLLNMFSSLPSIDHGRSTDPSRHLDITQPAGSAAAPAFIEAEFTYSVSWTPTTLSYDDRSSLYAQVTSTTNQMRH